MSVAPIKDRTVLVAHKTATEMNADTVTVAPKEFKRPAEFAWQYDRVVEKRLEVAAQVLAGLLSGQVRAESGPALAGLAWQYAGWLLEEAGK